MRLFSFILLVAFLTFSLRAVNLWHHSALGEGVNFINERFQQFAQSTNSGNLDEPGLESEGFSAQGNNNLTPIPIINDDDPPSDDTNEEEEEAGLQPIQSSSPSRATMEEASSGINRMIGRQEQELLNQLGERRLDLERREAEITRKEALLTAAEQQMVERQKNLEALNREIQEMIREFEDEKEEARSSVIQTYNIMKPRAAAAIFNELELDILINVVRSMTPRKLAQIMAQMDPIKAKELTTELANKEISVQQ